ncbi:MAG TPA: hypothetical protein VH022_14520 [Candidatus Acidoferrum sp.]|nr:hypothetical protein [Candidatus Acidoferrum sp.]
MKEKMAAAFNKWMDLYTNHPEQFAREFQIVSQHLKEREQGIEPSYGEQAAEYLSSLMQ